MRIKSVAIQAGVNHISLSEFGEFGYDISSMDFEANTTKYEFRMTKISLYGGMQDKTLVYKSESGQPFPYWHFIACRDGLTGMQLVSTCSGMLIVKLKPYERDNNPLTGVLKKFYNDNEERHYRQYFKTDNDGCILLTHKGLEDLKPYHRDTMIKYFQSENKPDNHKSVGKRFQVPKRHDVITHLEITSEMDTEASLRCGGCPLFTFDVMKGAHIYPCIIPAKYIYFQEIWLNFGEDIKEITIFSVVLPAPVHEQFKRSILLTDQYGQQLILMDGFFALKPHKSVYCRDNKIDLATPIGEQIIYQLHKL